MGLEFRAITPRTIHSLVAALKIVEMSARKIVNGQGIWPHEKHQMEGDLVQKTKKAQQGD